MTFQNDCREIGSPYPPSRWNVIPGPPSVKARLWLRDRVDNIIHRVLSWTANQLKSVNEIPKISPVAQAGSRKHAAIAKWLSKGRAAQAACTGIERQGCEAGIGDRRQGQLWAQGQDHVHAEPARLHAGWARSPRSRSLMPIRPMGRPRPRSGLPNTRPRVARLGRCC